MSGTGGLERWERGSKVRQHWSSRFWGLEGVRHFKKANRLGLIDNVGRLSQPRWLEQQKGASHVSTKGYRDGRFQKWVSWVKQAGDGVCIPGLDLALLDLRFWVWSEVLWTPTGKIRFENAKKHYILSDISVQKQAREGSVNKKKGSRAKCQPEQLVSYGCL